MIGRNNAEKMGNNGHIFEQEFKKSVPKGAYIKKLNGDVAFLGSVGNDIAGEFLLSFSEHTIFIVLRYLSIWRFPDISPA